MRHVTNLWKNIISIGQLAKDGYETTFTSDTRKNSKRAIIVVQCKKNGTLYLTIDGCDFL